MILVRCLLRTAKARRILRAPGAQALCGGFPERTPGVPPESKKLRYLRGCMPEKRVTCVFWTRPKRRVSGSCIGIRNEFPLIHLYKKGLLKTRQRRIHKGGSFVFANGEFEKESFNFSLAYGEHKKTQHFLGPDADNSARLKCRVALRATRPSEAGAEGWCGEQSFGPT